MNKQEFILNELRAIANDITDLVDSELEHIDEQAKRRVEARINPQGPMIGIPYDPNHLKPELNYFRSRLESIATYLG